MNMSVEAVKQKINPILEDAGVVRAALFGSVARGEADEESDVDILVELPEGRSLFDLVDLKIKLEEAAGKPVDLVTFRSVYPPLRGAIEREQVPIY